MSENLNALEKAQVLIEALPYIQRFNRKIKAGWIQTDHCAWRWQGDQQMGCQSRNGTGIYQWTA